MIDQQSKAEVSAFELIAGLFYVLVNAHLINLEKIRWQYFYSRNYNQASRSGMSHSVSFLQINYSMNFLAAG
jgi:hypothetical protein